MNQGAGALAEKALKERDHQAETDHYRRRFQTQTCSASAGMDCLLLANGTYANHTSDESVPRENLAGMLAICEASWRPPVPNPPGCKPDAEVAPGPRGFKTTA